MSQHDFNIANQGFPATRADINNAFQAIASNSSGATAPSTTYANMWWYDTTNNKMYLRNEADSAWIEVATIDQTNNEWQITTGVVQAKDSDGLALKTDDGTTRLFIKDSDGAVGIGTTSPAGALDISGGDVILNQSKDLKWMNTARDTTYGAIEGLAAGTLFKFGGSEAMRIDSSGKVGIGTSSPTSALHISQPSDASTGGLQIRNAADNNSIFIYQNDDLTTYDAGSSGSQAFKTANTERMRIDSSGNVLVGKTSADYTTAGTMSQASGTFSAVRDGGSPLFLNRLTNDGDIAVFRQDGTTRGTIGVQTGALTIDGGTNYTGVYYGTASWLPRDNGSNVDNAVDLGNSTYRFDDINATNGTIQTSDEREKQQIASLTDAEMTAAKAISKLFKTFKWNDAVNEKGDAARKHTGVIAQQVEQAITDAGLDAGEYAFFISSTWWETQTEVPAVEAVEAVEATYDEDGNVLTEAVEAVEGKEAYTRTDTYDTAEEAPEGATERNRKGIRYPELLSFIGAATEQRLASIESRLDALEA